jgi:catechol 2,3-dioxygenase-like lactoylglutathione lyase family enzyme
VSDSSENSPQPIGWTVSSVSPTIAVPDLELALEFYESLGFELEWSFPEEEPTHQSVRIGSVTLMMALTEPSERADLYFLVDDVDACFEFIVANKPWVIAERSRDSSERDDCPPDRSLRRPLEPEKRSYGMKDFEIIDPWGHQLTFGREDWQSDSE